MPERPDRGIGIDACGLFMNIIFLKDLCKNSDILGSLILKTFELLVLHEDQPFLIDCFHIDNLSHGNLILH